MNNTDEVGALMRLLEEVRHKKGLPPASDKRDRCERVCAIVAKLRAIEYLKPINQ